MSLRMVVRSLGRQLPLKKLVCDYGDSGPEVELKGSPLFTLGRKPVWS